MDIKQLKYFLAIAEEGSISKAAEKLHMAQPPLSHQLKLLEEELGVTLAERNTRRIEITDAGQLLCHRAAHILDLVEAARKELKDIGAGFQGTLSIGTVSSAGAGLLPMRISDFTKKYPNINFEVIDEDTSRIIELLNSGIIDIGIIRTPFNLEMFESIHLGEEPMVVCGINMPWIKETSLNIKALLDKPLIIQRIHEKNIVELCHAAGFEPRLICKSNDVRTMLLWADAGIGLAIVPKSCIGLTPNTKLQYIEISEPSLQKGTAVIWSRGKYLSSAAKQFLETFRDPSV